MFGWRRSRNSPGGPSAASSAPPRGNGPAGAARAHELLPEAESPADGGRIPAIVCSGLQKDFGDGEARVRALRGIDLTVYSGEMTLLAGPSGCGKTTLISVIAGLLRPTAGEVTVFDHDLQRITDDELVAFRAKNIGFVFQQFNLLPALTAMENAAVPLLIAGMPRAAALRRAAELLDLMGLAERRNALPSQLSGGQQQRVAIARAVVHAPRLLVCDEPTAALDARTGQTVMELIERTAVQPGRAVIVVTHDNRVFHFGDRLVTMDDGRIASVEDGPHRRAALQQTSREDS